MKNLIWLLVIFIIGYLAYLFMSKKNEPAENVVYLDANGKVTTKEKAASAVQAGTDWLGSFVGDNIKNKLNLD